VFELAGNGDDGTREFELPSIEANGETFGRLRDAETSPLGDGTGEGRGKETAVWEGDGERSGRLREDETTVGNGSGD
jgi:hypothetical protein